MRTIQEIREFCNQVAAEHGFTINFPIEVNGRLTRTIGRVTSRGKEVILMEFSKRHLEIAREESIKETVLHELAHVFVTLETGEDRGHDAVFKAMCARIGTSNDKTYHNNLKTIVPVENQHKYAIYCKSCGKFVCGRSRACKLTQTPEYYESNCCHSGLKVIQNW